MASLREEYEIIQKKNESPTGRIDRYLSELADGLENSIRRYIIEIDKKLQSTGSAPGMPFHCKGDPVWFSSMEILSSGGSSNRITIEDVKKSESYKKIHAACADPKVDMAVQVMTRGDLDDDPAGAKSAVIIVVFLNKPHNASSRADSLGGNNAVTPAIKLSL